MRPATLLTPKQTISILNYKLPFFRGHQFVCVDRNTVENICTRTCFLSYFYISLYKAAKYSMCNMVWSY